jgi:hypothetical protein
MRQFQLEQAGLGDQVQPAANLPALWRNMKNIKFVVKVNRGGAHAPQYVLRIDRLPIQTTTNRKLALVMGRFTAEDAVKSMQNSHCTPELVSVRVGA